MPEPAEAGGAGELTPQGGRARTSAPDDAAAPDDTAFHDPGLYATIHRRRDVRAQFTGAPIPDDVLVRILSAAHSAPSVGLSQPWDFVVVMDMGIRRRFWEHVQSERSRFAASLDEERSKVFANIKIEGILESSVSIVVTYDPSRGAPGVLGRYSIDEAGLYSVCLAIENLWLAATAEDLGMGWVSFYHEPFLRELLGIPETIRPVGWLCIGPVTHLEAVPDLERHGWRERRSLAEALHYDHWGATRSTPDARDIGAGVESA